MAHFAILDQNNTVINVVVVNNKDCFDTKTNQESELIGIEYLRKVYNNPEINFIQCSYNASIRKNYPGPGYVYNNILDAFIPPCPQNPDPQIIITPGEYILKTDTCSWHYTGELKT